MVLRSLVGWIRGWEPVKEITVSLTPKEAYFVDITCEPDHAYYLGDPKSRMWTLSHNCDDGVIESDALSKDIRAKRNSEYTTNIRTRFQPGYNCAEVVIGTQWAQGDLFDYVEEADKHSTDKWDIIKFPALLTDQASELIRKKDDPDDAYLPGTSF